MKVFFETAKSSKLQTSPNHFIFERFPPTVLKILSAQISFKDTFFLNFFQGLGAFYTNAKPLIWMLYFCTKYLILHFFEARLFDFNMIFKTSFKNLFRKI